jgi:hypothetical protein
MTYIKKMVPAIIFHKFMFGEGDKSGYAPFEYLGSGMQYFDCIGRKNNIKIPCTGLGRDIKQTELEAHPTAFILRDHDGFVKALAELGLDSSWVTLGNWTLETTTLDGTRHQSDKHYYQFEGFPIPNSSMVSGPTCTHMHKFVCPRTFC